MRPLAPIVAVLATDAAIVALCESRIWGIGPNPEDLAPNPEPARKAIVVRGNGATAHATVPFSRVRASIRCYGETFTDAYAVYAAVRDFFLRQGPRRINRAYFQGAIPGAGPFEFTDPDLGWPYVLAEWQVSINDREIPENAG